MRMPKRGEKGFTLIELLIVVAILGILAAVIIPNVGRFIGRGETEAKSTELQNVQAAVSSMMVDNNVTTLTPVAATNDMSAFPDTTYTGGVTVTAPDEAGLVLFGHDMDKEDATAGAINYVSFPTATCTYLAGADGTVTFQDGSTDPATGCP